VSRVVCFALERESTYFRRHRPAERVLILGVGAEAARNALQSLDASVDSLIVCGFAGALQPGIEIAQVIEVGEVIDESGNGWKCDSDSPSRLLTASRLIADPREKRELGQRFDATIVDMESAIVASFAVERNIPIRCIRTVSDTVDRGISPRLTRLINAGDVSPFRLMRELFVAPSLLVELLRLQRHTQRASRTLGEHLTAIL